MNENLQIDGLDVQIIVGLEIHVQLATQTKMFCACKLEFGAPPNSRTCPVCLGLPGSLPVMNRQAYELAVRTALALNCEIATFTKWDRKSYYYPDLPKNYQISQYDLPLSSNGWLEIPVSSSPSPAGGGPGRGDFNSGAGDGPAHDGSVAPSSSSRRPGVPASPRPLSVAPSSSKRVRIRRVHLEEDAGKLLHEGIGPYSQVDLNRAGTPLMEIVTEPDMNSPGDAGSFGRELLRIVQHNHVSDANMQMGQLRLEPNVNCLITTPDGQEFKTPIAEVKNLNSFENVESAIAYEARRQVAAWRKTGVTMASGNKSTMGWDPDRGATFVQREKEEAHDYRYFPDPDLLPVIMDDAWLARIRQTVVESPLKRQMRYCDPPFSLEWADAAQVTEKLIYCESFERQVALGAKPRRAAKMMSNQIRSREVAHGESVRALLTEASRLAELAIMLEEGQISMTAANQVLDEMLVRPESPKGIAERLNLMQTSDASAIGPIVDAAIAANAKAVEEARSGKKAEKALGFLVGQVMQKTRGAANPAMVRELLKNKLGLG